MLNRAMPDTQFGATAQRGADYASHILVTFMEVCRKRKKSFFVLFVDLVKAFEQVIRELVFGIPPGVTDVSKHLRDLVLTETQLNFLTSFIARHGSLFKEMGVHPRVVQLVCNLRASSWVTCGSLESAIKVPCLVASVSRGFHVVDACWPVVHLAGCCCFFFFLSTRRTVHNHACANTISPAPATAPLRTHEFDASLIHHVCLRLARSSMDRLCLACRSSDAVQKVFISPLSVLLGVAATVEPKCEIIQLLLPAQRRELIRPLASEHRRYRCFSVETCKVRRFVSHRIPMAPTLQ